MPKPELAYAEIEAAYQQAMAGSGEPSLIAGKCPKCGNGFILTKKSAEVCDCMREVLSAKA